MIKYYTRACNFFHGNLAKQLVAKKKALPLCGIKDIAFDQVELFTRKKRSVKVKLIKIKEIQKTRTLQNFLKTVVPCTTLTSTLYCTGYDNLIKVTKINVWDDGVLSDT